MPPLTPARARLCLVFAALLFATGGPAIKACGLSGWQIASFRSGVAAACLLAFARPAWAAFGPRALLVGLAHGATMVLFVAANKLTTASHAIFLQDSSILHVLLLAPWLLRERLRRHDALVVVLVVAGMVLLFAGDPVSVSTAPRPVLGNVLAGISGLTWALTVVGMRWLASAPSALARPGEAALAAVVYGNLLSFLAALLPALPVEALRASDLGWVLYLGAIQIAVAYVLVSRGLAGVTALEGSVLLLFEPVLNSLFTWLVHGEDPGRPALLGGAAILAATLWKAWCERGGAPALRAADRGAGSPAP